MIQIRRGKNGKSLGDLAEEHWKYINPNVKSVYGGDSVIGRIQSKINEPSIDKGRKAFYQELLSKDNLLLKRIIKSEIENYPELIKIVSNLVRGLSLTLDMKEGELGYELLKSIFNYSSWRSNGGAKKHFEALGVEVCPYCNLETVHKDIERGFLVASYDHFYDKATYPYFCLSFYNLIPVCQKCNLTYKGTSAFSIETHLHPYHDDYDSLARFDSSYSEGVASYEVKLHFEASQKKRTEAISEKLGFAVRYNEGNVKKHSKNIYQVSKDYPESQKSDFMNNFGISREELEIKICNERDIPYRKADILNHQFGKLKRDCAIKYSVLTVERII